MGSARACFLIASSLPQAQDPFAGPAPVSVEVVQKYCRIDKSKEVRTSQRVGSGCRRECLGELNGGGALL